MEPNSPGSALVTGAARRVGRAIAIDLGRRGWAVAVHYRGSAAEALRVVEEIRDGGGRAEALQADLSDAAAAEALVPRAARLVGPLNCLINNASLFEMDTVETATAESWNRHLDTNLRAPFLLSQGFARQLPQHQEGNIVNLIDMRVWKPTAFFASYTVSKSGLWTLTRTLAMALAPRIRVNGIGPGPTLPNARQSPEQFAAQVAATPLGRGAGPEEICEGLHYILSARSMTGQMIALDGGQHLPSPPLHQGPEVEE